MTLRVDLRACPGLNSAWTITGTVEEVAPDVDPLAVMHTWLANIDPGELERAALESMELGSGSYASEVLLVLRRWAGGNP